MATHTEETKEKMRKAWTPQRRYELAQRNKRFKNRVVSEETRKKMSQATSGENNPRYGIHLSEEQKQKQRNTLLQTYREHPEIKQRISESKKGAIVSKETRKIISINNSGEGNPMYGRKHTEEAKKKISDANKGRLVGELNLFFGKHHTEETKLIVSIAHKGENSPSKRPEFRIFMSERMKLENNPAWIDGRSYEPYCPKFNKDLRIRIREFFNNECILCGKTAEENGRQLCCHHVEYNKQACCDGLPVQFAVVCNSCHTKTNHDRERWENIFHIIIRELYDNRSYFTKEEYLNRCNK